MPLHIKKRIKSTVWPRTADSLNVIEPLTYQVPAGFKFLAHVLDTTLVAFEGGQGRILTDAGGIARFLALHVVHGLDEMTRADRPAHTPARHGVAFADA